MSEDAKEILKKFGQHNLCKCSKCVAVIDELLQKLSELEGELAKAVARINQLLDREKLALIKEAKLESQVAGLRNLIERSRHYVQMVWDETKGTSREGTAMGAAGILNDIAALDAAGKEEKEK